MQRQAKRVTVPCVNTTALQCWPHWHPTMLSIPHCLHNTTTLPLPCASPPLREPLLPYARYLSFQPHVGECRHAEWPPASSQLSLRGVPLWQRSFERLFTHLHPAWTRKACSIKSWHWGFVGVPVPRAWELSAPGCPQHLPTDRHFTSSKINWEVFIQGRV